MAGEHLTKPPYGYKVDPANRKKWIVDEEAAAVVKRILATREQQAIFRNNHEVIVEEAVFERVQELKVHKRRPQRQSNGN